MSNEFRVGTFVAAFGLVEASCLMGASPALASPETPEASSISSGTMTVVGFDRAVAEAHGFKVVDNPDGTQSSVPITSEAKAILAGVPTSTARALSTSQSSTVQPNAVGNCGTDSLHVVPRASAGAVVISTAYSVYIASVGHVWNVDGVTTSVGFSEPFSGANFSSTWTATHVHAVPGFAHGHATIRAGSYAILINGDICAALPETSTW